LRLWNHLPKRLTASRIRCCSPFVSCILSFYIDAKSLLAGCRASDGEVGLVCRGPFDPAILFRWRVNALSAPEFVPV
jgi:hypothetical protein